MNGTRDWVGLAQFVLADEPCGALVRVRDAAGLRTYLTYLGPGGGLVQFESTVDFAGPDPRRWTGYRHSERHADRHFEVARPDGLPADTLPGCATCLLVAELAAGEAEVLRLHTLDAGEPGARPVAVELRRSGDLVEEVRDGVVGNRHWVDRHGVVASDWQGARSRREPDLPTLIASLPAHLAAPVRDLAARAEIT